MLRQAMANVRLGALVDSERTLVRAGQRVQTPKSSRQPCELVMTRPPEQPRWSVNRARIPPPLGARFQ